MKGLFCFDGPLYKDRDGIYCSLTLTNEMFNRYFDVIDELVVVVRTYCKEETYQELNMNPLNLDRIIVVEVENILSVKGLMIEKKRLENQFREILEDIDVIFARMPSVISNSVLKTAQQMKKKYLVEVGGCAWDSYWNHGFYGKILAPYMYASERKYIKNANFATYVTKYFLQKRYPTKGESIDCSNVYIENQDNALLDERLRNIKNCNSKRILGTAVNSIDVKYKGEHLIIEIIPKLVAMGYDIEYQIVGPGEGSFLKEQIKRYKVEKNVKILGAKTKGEMVDWYKSIDIYVQPSKQEGLPRSVIEAMSVGCPALGSNIAGIPELLESQYMFNPNKSNEIVNAFKVILQKENMQICAENNFIKAKVYTKDVLHLRRKLFFEKYKESIT